MENRSVTGSTPSITNVRLIPARTSTDGLIFFASFVVYGQIFIGNVAVRLRPDGRALRLTFPEKILPNGLALSCAHPITQEMNTAMIDAVADKIREVNLKCGELVGEYKKLLGTKNVHKNTE